MSTRKEQENFVELEIELPNDTYEKLVLKAAKRDISLNDAVIEAVNQRFYGNKDETTNSTQ